MRFREGFLAWVGVEAAALELCLGKEEFVGVAFDREWMRELRLGGGGISTHSSALPRLRPLTFLGFGVFEGDSTIDVGAEAVSLSMLDVGASFLGTGANESLVCLRPFVDIFEGPAKTSGQTRPQR